MNLRQRHFASLSAGRLVRVECGKNSTPEDATAPNLEAAIAQVRDVAKVIAKGQEKVESAMQSVVEAINKETRAVFDKSGKVIGSRKVG